MENYQGDLADVVRSIRTQVLQTSSFNYGSPPPPTWQLPENGGFFHDPFSTNPLPHELDVTRGCFFNTPLLEENVGLDLDKEDITSCSSTTCVGGGGGVFTRMLQISSDTQLSSIVDGAAGEGNSSFTCNNGGGVQISSPRSSGVKRRKSQVKKVVCIPAPGPASSRPSSGEVVPSDLWAWRKYGQKPIKGSPYPRGYYRCSSSKGCSARKQVERSRSDPNMLVITYTSEHNHPWPTQRNALAGSTRAQPPKTGRSPPPPSSHDHNPPFNNNTDFYCHEASPILTDTPAAPPPPPPPRSSNQHKETTKIKPGAPMETDEGDHDFFADLDEIETDPLTSHGFGDFESLGIFDWTAAGGTCSFGEEEEEEEEANLKSGL